MKSLEDLVSLLLQLVNGFWVTLSIFVLTLLFAIPLATPIALGRMSKNRILSKIVGFFQLIIRGTPLLLQIIFVYFAPYYIFGAKLSGYRFPATIIAFSTNYAAYFSEIYRGGLESIPIGQYEAAQVLGFSKSQTFFRIILPQVIKRILPPMSNEVITLIKDTALAATIAVQEMFRVANSSAATNVSIAPIVFAGGFYLAASYLITRAFTWGEKKLSYYH
ncbi:MAG: amino acid ABC transporter permease [Bacillota bacterium]|nr:amino acid ABC transporter permease [Bacillota bacterium]